MICNWDEDHVCNGIQSCNKQHAQEPNWCAGSSATDFDILRPKVLQSAQQAQPNSPSIHSHVDARAILFQTALVVSTSNPTLCITIASARVLTEPGSQARDDIPSAIRHHKAPA